MLKSRLPLLWGRGEQKGVSPWESGVSQAGEREPDAVGGLRENRFLRGSWGPHRLQVSRKSSPSVAAPPPTLFSWLWARESVPNIKEVPQKGSFRFTPPPNPS